MTRRRWRPALGRETSARSLRLPRGTGDASGAGGRWLLAEPAPERTAWSNLRRALVHGMLGVRHWRALWNVWQAPVDGPLAHLVRARPEIWGLLQAPFLSAAWTTQERFARIIDHCAVVEGLGHPFDLRPHEFVDLLDLPELGEGACIKLDSPRWFLRDGLLVVSLWIGANRAYSLAFILAQEKAGLTAYVGGLQGRRGEDSLDLNRSITKAAHGLRPPALLTEVFRMICDEIGVAAIRCVSNSNRHQRSDYFQRRPHFVDPVQFDYNRFWSEMGGSLELDDFFAMPVRASPRSEASIPARKRPLYRRRRQMIALLRDRLRNRLASRDDIALREHEPVWI